MHRRRERRRVKAQTTLQPSAIIYHDRPWSTMVDHGRPWSTVVDHGRPWSTMVGHGRPWTTMVDPWSTIVDHARPWSTMVDRGRPGDVLIFIALLYFTLICFAKGMHCITLNTWRPRLFILSWSLGLSHRLVHARPVWAKLKA